MQFAFFPGDPGEDEVEFKDNWAIDIEPVPSVIDKWSTNVVNIKKVSKVQQESNEEEPQTERSFKSSSKSKRPLSVTSKRSMMRRTNMTHLNKDLDNKSRIDTTSNIDRKENLNNINISVTAQSAHQKLVLQVPLDVAPPLVISEEEKQMRDKKDKQLKEMREQREKEEREKLRQKSRLDAQTELEKHEYTYDDNGTIIFVKKPNLQKLLNAQIQKPEFQIQTEEAQTQSQKQLPPKIRIKSAKIEMKRASQLTNRVSQEKIVEIELELKAQKEIEDNYQKIFGPKQDATHDYGSALDAIEVQAGIIINKENQRLIGPPIYRERMTLAEYQKISQEFDFGSERMKKYDSQKKILNPKLIGSDLDIIIDDASSNQSRRGFSGERMIKMAGAETVYDREITVQEYKYLKKAQRKDLKSATARKAYDQVIEKHNRISSAQAQDVRIRNQIQKKDVKARIFNYENYIGGVDMGGPSGMVSPSVYSGSRPMSGLSGVQSQKLIKQDKPKLPPKKPVSIIDEYNKKILEGGADRQVNPTDLPPVIKQHIIKNNTNHQRPQTSKPIIQHNNFHSKKNFSNLDSVDQLPSGAQTEVVLSTKNQNKKFPRERIISAKVKQDQDKLPPPPFGKTMGHGLLAK